MKPYQTCGNCRHYSAPNKPSGDCRIHPPQVIPIGLPPLSKGPVVTAAWPIVRSADWCSAFTMSPGFCPGAKDQERRCTYCEGNHLDPGD